MKKPLALFTLFISISTHSYGMFGPLSSLDSKLPCVECEHDSIIRIMENGNNLADWQKHNKLFYDPDWHALKKEEERRAIVEENLQTETVKTIVRGIQQEKKTTSYNPPANEYTPHRDRFAEAREMVDQLILEHPNQREAILANFYSPKTAALIQIQQDADRAGAALLASLFNKPTKPHTSKMHHEGPPSLGHTTTPQVTPHTSPIKIQKTKISPSDKISPKDLKKVRRLSY